MGAEVKEFNIIKLDRYPVNERNKYPQVVVEIMGNNGTVKGYANEGNWNKDWAVGKKGRAGVEMKKSKEGNVYAKLSCPEDMKPKQGQHSAQTTPSVETPSLEKEILEKVNTILDILVTGSQAKDTSHDVPLSSPDEPQAEPEINIEDIPF